MTNREAIEFASKNSFQALYEKGFSDGKHEAIVRQANHDQAVRDAHTQGRREGISDFIAELITADSWHSLDVQLFFEIQEKLLNSNT